MGPPLRLYTPPGSFYALAPLIAAEYCEVPIVVHTNNLGDVVANKSPSGKLPLLETSHGVIFGSEAIMRYVSGLNPSQELAGVSSTERLQVDGWIDWAFHDLELPCSILWYSHAESLQAPQEATTKAWFDLRVALTILEGSLQRQPYLCGSKLTMADIAVSSKLAYPFKFVCDKPFLKEFQATWEWYLRCAMQSQFASVLGTKIMLAESDSQSLHPIETS